MDFRGVIAAAVAALTCAPAMADVYTFTDPGAFAAATGHIELFKFNIRTGDIDGIPVSSPYTYGPVTFEAASLYGFTDGFISYPGMITSGPSYLDTSKELRVASSTSAIGLFLGSYYFVPDTVRFDSRGVTGSIRVSETYWGAGFLGIIDTSGSVDVTLYKDLVDLAVGSFYLPVPEPAAWAMMLLGFGAIGAGARRARRQRQLALG